MIAIRQQVELLEKNKPRQERAKRTYEGILAAAAELLVEVGVERISTNIMAERAGITVPALYRYFPNKYAVLNALGAVLMDRQNQVFQAWFEQHMDEKNPLALLDKLEELLQQTYDVTREQTGGLEIIQSLQAVGPLQELRLASHRLVAEQLTELIAQILGREADTKISVQARVCVDTGYGVVEMALQDPALPTEEVLNQGAIMLRVYLYDVLQDLT